MHDKFLKPYNPQETEDAIYTMWEESGYFNPDNLPDQNTRTEAYTVVLPPPNVTGVLHMGHAYEDSLQDAVIRYQRMRGKKALWIPGTDSAAIATQARVEKNLKKDEGKTRHDLGREEMVRRVAEFAKASEDSILNQVKHMGASLDWSRYAYTLDEKRNRAVFTAFKRMYDVGLIYRGHRIVNWDPKGQTTISDDEVVYEEEKSKFYYFKYGPFTIGTARPETKFSDKYVVIHPDDARYKEYEHGQKIEVEWINGPITATIIKDEASDPEMGSGVMTITPWHSQVDFELAEKYGLQKEQIIDTYGKLLPVAGEFAGMKIAEAREKIVEKLKEKGLVVEIDENYVHNIATSERTGAVIEPQVLEQWFIAVDKFFTLPHSEIPGIESGAKTTLKDMMRIAVESGAVSMPQERFKKIYFHWINNLHDWCISRQIWFGHRIPVWYCGDSRMKRMGFAGDIVSQVFDGKISTWRLRDHGINTGDEVAFEDSSKGTIFGYGTMTSVEQTTVRDIDLSDSKHYATYKNHDELIAAFKRHNPHKTVTLDSPVWVYTYTFDKALKKNACGGIIVSVDEPTSCPSCGSTQLAQDEDVLDTWFSSALWTFSTLGWPEETKDLKTFHPTAFMSPAYEILPLWVSRMILMSGFHLGQAPFNTVMIHGLVRDKQGRKFSKSLGNGIDPLDLIQQYGADAVRMGLLVGTAIGNDISFDEQKVKGYKHFANKLWNVTRFILENTEEVDYTKPVQLSSQDQKILNEVKTQVADITSEFEKYQLYLAAEKIYHYVWHEIADKILEESKPILQGDDAEAKRSRQHTLYTLLTTSLKMLHPFMPFVTEEIWQSLPHKDSELLMVATWPTQ